MDAAAYQHLTDELVARLREDDRVIGLVALGSMAATERTPDQWSDHDFWVVTVDGAADSFRAESGWLPGAADIVVSFAETAHGRSAIYADGHLVEFAVFDDPDVEMARANAYRVLLDDCRLEERMRALPARHILGGRRGRAARRSRSDRRFESSLPALAREIDAALNSPTLDCAESLLSVARRELSGPVAVATPASILAVRSTIDRARSEAAP